MSSKLSILLVDDDQQFLEMVSYNLELAGHKVKTAENGPAAIEIAGVEPRPDVILLDTTMPEMDGLQVLMKLKNQEVTQDIPVFMLTGKSMMGDIERAFELGADDYITKPVEIMKLSNLIKKKMDKFNQS